VNRPAEPATGHAAVGWVTGQRFADGGRPEWVRIEYRRDGNRTSEVVLRSSGRAEGHGFGEDVITFAGRTHNAGETRTIPVEDLLGAEPVEF